MAQFFKNVQVERYVFLNENGGFYSPGLSFSEAKWQSIINTYHQTIDKESVCTVYRLSEICKISTFSAKKAIQYSRTGKIPCNKIRGHGKHGIGALKGLKMKHHHYLYKLYRKQPSRPIESYQQKFFKKYSIIISHGFVQNWFKEIGPFKGSMRLTSHFPPNKYSNDNMQKVHDYLTFMSRIDHKNVVFGDEKPFKGVDIFDRVRRDPFTGEVPHLVCNSDFKNCYNVFAFCSLKRDKPTCTRVVKETGDAIAFSEFVAIGLEERILMAGDILVVDNCSIHFSGDNESLQDVLLKQHNILLMTLLPYFAELNPTELIF